MSTVPKTPAPGDSFRCAACGRDTIAKTQRVMDGWRYVGDAVVCAFCQAPVAPPVPPAPAGRPPGAATAGAAALDRLASLLDERPVAAPTFKNKDKGHFCKDCLHFFKHPFYSQCLKHDRHVEPMEDCDAFAPRPDGSPPVPPAKEPRL